jgi:hemerythrin superfamily protein
MPRAQRTKTEGATPARSSGRRSTRQGRDDHASRVIEMLTADHEMVKKLFRQGERIEDDTDRLQAIVDEACHALTEHAEIEEEFFYPALRETDARELIAEAEVEHNSAKQLIADLQGMDADDERYRATFKVLGEYVKHHVKEEESEIFPLARASKADFEPLLEALSARSGDGEDEAEGEDTAESEDDGSTGEAPEASTPKRSRRVGRTTRSGR